MIMNGTIVQTVNLTNNTSSVTLYMPPPLVYWDPIQKACANCTLENCAMCNFSVST
jgi:hypothetical protein